MRKTNVKVADDSVLIKGLKIKMYEYPLQRQIYFLTFMELLDIVFSQYKEICEVVLDSPRIGGDDIKYYIRKTITNHLHANLDVHSRRLIAEFPVNGVKFISKPQPVVTVGA